MQLSIRQIIDKITKHFSMFGLALTVFVLAWTYYSVTDLWHGIKSDLCKDEHNIRHCSTWNDLASSLTYLLFGVSLFFVVINPLTYHPRKSILRAVIIFPIFLTLAIITMIGTWHAGYINEIHLGWWLIMTLIDTTLILIGLILKLRETNHL